MITSLDKADVSVLLQGTRIGSLCFHSSVLCLHGSGLCKHSSILCLLQFGATIRSMLSQYNASVVTIISVICHMSWCLLQSHSLGANSVRCHYSDLNFGAITMTSISQWHQFGDPIVRRSQWYYNDDGSGANTVWCYHNDK